MIGKESLELDGVIEYNFECSCGWWGVLRISDQRELVKCVKCGQLYHQHHDDDTDQYELNTRIH